MFVNISNDNHDLWDENQITAAKALSGVEEIITLPVPEIPTTACSEEVWTLAETCAAIIPQQTTVALIDGDQVFTFEMVRLLQQQGITCVAAVHELADSLSPGGKYYKFVQFRTYPR